MRSRLSLTLAAILASGALVILAAAPASAHTTHHTGPGTIVDVAIAASGGGTPDSDHRDYDILIQALVATDLAPVLADTSTKYTVFAPNDRAFLRLVEDLTGSKPASEAAAVDTIVGALSVDQISNILLGHVVVGKTLRPLQVLFAHKITMANGTVITPRCLTLRDENPDFRDPRLVLSGLGIKASNGVIHTIDRVLLPATI